MARTWTSSDPRWLKLNPYQRAAAMALMEADARNPSDARDALGAMINRAAKAGVNLGDHVSGSIYQPTIEPGQQARLDGILKSPEFTDLTGWAERRATGFEPDPVKGATHFLAPEKTMLALERQNPSKYRNWGPSGANWTGYDPATGSYKGVVMRDTSHAFLAPEGSFSVPGTAGRVNAAQNGAISGGQAPSFPGPSQSINPAPTAVASAGPDQAGLHDNPDQYEGLLSSLFGEKDQQGFKPIMDRVGDASAAAIPQAPTASFAPVPDMRKPIDISQLLSIVANRQKLGVA